METRSRIIREPSRFTKDLSKFSNQTRVVQSNIVRESPKVVQSNIVRESSRIAQSNIVKESPRVARKSSVHINNRPIKSESTFRLPTLDSLSQFDDVIKIQFLEKMSCNDLREMSTYKQFKHLITSDMINKAANRGYPRPSGKAKVHHVNDFIKAKELKPYHDIYDEFNKNRNTLSVYNVHVKKYNFDDKFRQDLEDSVVNYGNSRMAAAIVQDKVKDETLKLMKGFKIDDLVKGDIVRVVIRDSISGLVVIYDGCNFIKADPMPQLFKVLKDGVPIDYWTDKDGFLEYVKEINFDPRPYRDELIRNLYYNTIGYTASKFIANGKVYNVLFLTYGTDNEKIIHAINNDEVVQVQYGGLNALHW